jgi:hypothetical protein
LASKSRFDRRKQCVERGKKSEDRFPLRRPSGIEKQKLKEIAANAVSEFLAKGKVIKQIPIVKEKEKKPRIKRHRNVRFRDKFVAMTGI